MTNGTVHWVAEMNTRELRGHHHSLWISYNPNVSCDGNNTWPLAQRRQPKKSHNRLEKNGLQAESWTEKNKTILLQDCRESDKELRETNNGLEGFSFIHPFAPFVRTWVNLNCAVAAAPTSKDCIFSKSVADEVATRACMSKQVYIIYYCNKERGH